MNFALYASLFLLLAGVLTADYSSFSNSEMEVPRKKFGSQYYRKQIAKSESQFLIEMYKKKKKFYEVDPEDHWKMLSTQHQHKLTIRNSNYISTYGVKKSPLNQTQHDLVLGFNLSSVAKVENLIGAELRLFRKPINIQKQIYKIITYCYIKDEILTLSEYIWTHLDYGWMVINVSKLFTRNIKQTSLVYIYVSAKIDCLNIAEEEEELGISGIKSRLAERPFLVAYYDADVKVKAPEIVTTAKKFRNAGRELTEPVFREFTAESCTLKTWWVDINTIFQLKSIIMPRQYRANYCIRKCSFPLQGKITNHAMFLALYSITQSNLTPQCAPDELSPIDIIYVDQNNNIVQKTYDDMIVESCICK